MNPIASLISAMTAQSEEVDKLLSEAERLGRLESGSSAAGLVSLTLAYFGVFFSIAGPLGIVAGGLLAFVFWNLVCDRSKKARLTKLEEASKLRAKHMQDGFDSLEKELGKDAQCENPPQVIISPPFSSQGH